MAERDLIAEVLAREGGFVNHPDDRGGPTNFGITQATLAWWRKHPVTAEEVHGLSREEAIQILQAQYVDNPGFGRLNIPTFLRHQLIDYGVNSGPALAIKKVQSILNVEPDGVIGPITTAALEVADHRVINNQLVVARLLMIGRILSRDKSQAAFAYGWINRACSFLHL